jgi:hypothetical protein
VLYKTSHEVWSTLATNYSGASRARSMNTRVQLATLKKGGLSTIEYFNKMKALTDTLAITSQPLKDEEFISYLLVGLDESYDSSVTSVTTRDDAIPLSELFAYLLSQESRIESRQTTPKTNEYSTNFANRGRGRAPIRGRGCGGCFSPTERGGNVNNSSSGTSGGSSGKKNPCQICGKLGHSATKCRYRYDQGSKEEHSANAVTTSYNVDPSWYADTGATDHITNDLEKMAMKEEYQGTDQVAVANGQGMYICHISQSKFHTTSRTLILKDILHVPSITRNLLSVRKFAIDNHVFFEFHPHFLLVKDLATREVLIRGWCQDGIYILNLAFLHTTLQNLLGIIDDTNKAPPETITKMIADGAVQETNLEFLTWYSQDQAILGALLTSLSESVLGRVCSTKPLMRCGVHWLQITLVIMTGYKTFIF